jgi:hypothetical protein
VDLRRETDQPAPVRPTPVVAADPYAPLFDAPRSSDGAPLFDAPRGRIEDGGPLDGVNLWQGELTGGRAYLLATDTNRIDAAQRWQPHPDRYNIFAHGDEAGADVGAVRLDATQLADVIRADERWQGQALQLFICESGVGPYPLAQQLADELGVSVWAPNMIVGVDADGQALFARDNGDGTITMRADDGRFVEFTPGAPTVEGEIVDG